MIEAVAVCPHPPLLVPEIAAGAAGETDDLRAACGTAIARMLASNPAQIVVVGAEGPTGVHRGLRGFAPGVESLANDDVPLSLAIGTWLLDRAAASPPRRLIAVRADGTPTTPWPATSVTTGLLVMADGSARRGVKAPGYLDERAEPFDRVVVKALAEADVEVLANLDTELADELLVGGVGPWKALAALATERHWAGDVLYDAAPYGVQYTVAFWS